MKPTIAQLIPRTPTVSASTTTRKSVRYALKSRLTAHSPYPIIPRCPPPTCPCADTPPDLDIDRSKPLNGTMAAHSAQLLIATGQSDWTSRIEDAHKDAANPAPWAEMVLNLKKVLGRGGEFHDPYNNIAIQACSFQEPAYSQGDQRARARAFLFPSFQQIDQIRTDHEGVLDFVENFLIPSTKSTGRNHSQLQMTGQGSSDHKDTNSNHWLDKVTPISTPTVMICSHNSRDARCGILGPLLHDEFTRYIEKRQLKRTDPEALSSSTDRGGKDVDIGMISHVGGHKWAGNVIVYIPPNKSPEGQQGDNHALAGKTIWYGRVEPKHVEGIVEETIFGGKMIEELFRGGLKGDGSVLRI